MKKRAKILLIIIILVAVLMGILYLISIITGIDMTGKVTGFVSQKNEPVNKTYLDSIISRGIEQINQDDKYLDFISKSQYQSVEVKIGEYTYYLDFDSEQRIVFENQGKEMDFKMKISTRKFNKAAALYEQGNTKGAAMKIIGEIPRRQKISLFKQCMETEWCKQGNL